MKLRFGSTVVALNFIQSFVLQVHTKHDDDQNLHQWVKDYKLVEWGKQTLFYEYLEMGKLRDLLHLSNILK